MSAIERKSFTEDQRVFTLSSVLSPAECAELVRRAEGVGFTEAPITVGPNRFLMAPDYRNNRRVMLDDRGLATLLWERIERWVPTQWGSSIALGLNERLRFYRYTPGQFFDWHRDGAFVRSAEERSLFTVLFYLNEGFEGGTTDFMEQGLSVAPRQGMALLFVHPESHRGAPVVSGTKYVLRSDVMYVRA